MTTENVTIPTTRFGEISVAAEKIITFPKGLLGFEHCRRYCLIADEQTTPLVYMQSLEDPALAFVVVDPRVFYPAYKVEIDPNEIAELEVDDVNDITTWVIVTVPEDFTRLSVNLQGPLLLNTRSNRAKQVVLTRSAYTTCHCIADALPGGTPGAEVADQQPAPV